MIFFFWHLKIIQFWYATLCTCKRSVLIHEVYQICSHPILALKQDGQDTPPMISFIKRLVYTDSVEFLFTDVTTINTALTTSWPCRSASGNTHLPQTGRGRLRGRGETVTAIWRGWMNLTPQTRTLWQISWRKSPNKLNFIIHLFYLLFLILNIFRNYFEIPYMYIVFLTLIQMAKLGCDWHAHQV